MAILITNANVNIKYFCLPMAGMPTIKRKIRDEEKIDVLKKSLNLYQFNEIEIFIINL